MTGRAPVDVIPSSDVKMLRFIVLSCCVVLSTCQLNNCGQNEEMKCVQSCPPQKTCRNRDIQFRCSEDVQPCHQICVCKPGFLRNAVGTCITNEECDMCQRDNEYFACGSACDNECAKLDTQNKTNCPIKNIVCNRKCYCEDGFARDDKGNCIPIEKCHLINCTRANEHYECGSACQTECATLGQTCPIVNVRCNDACYCNDGCARDSSGTCVEISKCERCV